MKKEPIINKIKLKRIIEQNYPFRVKSFSFIKKGEDANSYIINSNKGIKYVIKIYDPIKIKKLNLGINFDNFAVLEKIHDRGIENISYPIKNNLGELLNKFDRYYFIITHFFLGKNDEKPMGLPHLKLFAELLAKVHSIKNMDKLVNSKEDFDGKNLHDLKEILTNIEEYSSRNSTFQSKIFRLLKPNVEKMIEFVDEIEKIRVRYINDDKLFVVVHSDPYFLNLIRGKNSVYLIDWDGIKMAPKEKDIWFYLYKNICSNPRIFLEYYAKHSKKFKINKDLVHYYLGRQVIDDTLQFLKKILSGNENKEYVNEIRYYSVKWMINYRKMFDDIDKIVEWWNIK